MSSNAMVLEQHMAFNWRKFLFLSIGILLFTVV